MGLSGYEYVVLLAVLRLSCSTKPPIAYTQATTHFLLQKSTGGRHRFDDWPCDAPEYDAARDGRGDAKASRE